MAIEDKNKELLIKKWRSRIYRYIFFSGMVCAFLFLNLSFILPHVELIIKRAYIPCILFLLFLIQQYFQYQKETKNMVKVIE